MAKKVSVPLQIARLLCQLRYADMMKMAGELRGHVLILKDYEMADRLHDWAIAKRRKKKR